MKPLKYEIFLVLLSFFAGVMDAKSQDAGAILEKMDRIIFSPKDKQAQVTMILTDKAGKEKVREAIMLQKGYDKSCTGIQNLNLRQESRLFRYPMM